MNTHCAQIIWSPEKYNHNSIKCLKISSHTWGHFNYLSVHHPSLWRTSSSYLCRIPLLPPDPIPSPSSPRGLNWGFLSSHHCLTDFKNELEVNTSTWKSFRLRLGWEGVKNGGREFILFNGESTLIWTQSLLPVFKSPTSHGNIVLP